MTRTRTITLFQPLREVAPELAAAFDSDPSAFLPEARHHGPDTWRVTLHGPGVQRDVDLHVGPVFQWADGHWRSMTWTPVSLSTDVLPIEKLLPSFAGELGLQIEARSLVLTGWYEPPLGAVGSIVDAVALQSLARATGRQLLGDIALRLAQPASV